MHNNRTSVLNTREKVRTAVHPNDITVMFTGVSIKFEVASQFEKSRRRYCQGAARIVLKLLQFRQKVANVSDRSSRRSSSDVTAY